MATLKVKEVDYNLYCNKCIHEKKEEYEDPCHDCLTHGWNEGSHKPVYFKEKEE